MNTTTFAKDIGKYVNDKLVSLAELSIVLPQFFEKRSLPQGNGKTAYFIQYQRADLQMIPLTEGTPPAESTFSVTERTVTCDQFGLYFALTDVSVLTTKHPVFNETMKLMADAVSRIENALAADALSYSTNRQYWDGSRANRGAITATDYINATVLNKARATLLDAGVPTREGELFVAVMGPQVQADILAESAGTNITNFATLQGQSGNIAKIERGTVGVWLGFKIVRTNLIPKFTRQTITMTGVAGAAGGSLSASTTYYYKVVRKSTQRGFGEDIAVEASQATGAGQGTINMTTPAGAGYLYDIYFGSATGDANLFLYASNVAPATQASITSVPANTAQPVPATPGAGVTVHPTYVFGAEACDEVPLDGSNMQGMVTPATPSYSDPLVQVRKMGAKWMTKRAIRDNTRLLVVECASRF
ncbi:major capsid protein [Caudoviricetes sp.]|nr:major capsid protein [Caudoviricetes sp.]